MIHSVTGELTFQPYGKGNQAIWSVSRGGLNCELMDLAEKNSNVKFYFNERCTHIDLKTATSYFENQSSLKSSEVKSDIVFGGDGAFSAARLQMQLSTDGFNYSQHYLEHGYKELSIPADANGQWQMEKNSLHIWPRGGYMLIALPNIDGSFTCTVFFPLKGELSFASLTNEELVQSFFDKIFPDALKLMPTLSHDFF